MWFAAQYPARVERLMLVAASVVGRSRQEFLDSVDSSWGTGRVLQSVWLRGAPDGSLPEFARYERTTSSR